MESYPSKRLCYLMKHVIPSRTCNGIIHTKKRTRISPEILSQATWNASFNEQILKPVHYIQPNYIEKQCAYAMHRANTTLFTLLLINLISGLFETRYYPEFVMAKTFSKRSIIMENNTSCKKFSALLVA